MSNPFESFQRFTKPFFEQYSNKEQHMSNRRSASVGNLPTFKVDFTECPNPSLRPSTGGLSETEPSSHRPHNKWHERKVSLFEPTTTTNVGESTLIEIHHSDH